jgi:hypothetical protein
VGELDSKFWLAAFFGIATLVFNILNRWFPPTKPSEVTASSSAAPATSARPKIDFLWSGLTLVCFFLTLFFAHQWGLSSAQQGREGPQGPPGAQGLQGIQGPQGVPGPSGATGAMTPDPKVDELRNIVAAFVKASFLEQELKSLDDNYSNWKKATKEHLDTVKLGNPSDIFKSKRLGFITTPINLAESNIKTIIKKTLNSDVVFNLHPNFDDNHHLIVPDIDSIPDDYSKEEYRRLYDQYNTTDNLIRLNVEKLRAAIADANKTILSYATKN